MLRLVAGLLLMAAILPMSAARAATPTAITIEVNDLHCANCARKLTSRLFAVPGVVSIKTDLAANTATVTPQANRLPSPRAMWEAAEKAGFKPLKIVGPSGTFTTKPGA